MHFLGRVDDREAIRAHLDQADLFCMPSHTEGLPRALVEAMARGVPAIGTRVGGIPELLPDEQMVEPGSPAALAVLISALVGSAERLNRASLFGWERAARYSPRKQAELRGRWMHELRQLIVARVVLRAEEVVSR